MRYFRNLPEAIDLHHPADVLYVCNNVVSTKPSSQETSLRHEDADSLCLQLVNWCMIQRFWYHILDMPQVTDSEYDHIEEAVKGLEAEYGLPINPYSPSLCVGSNSLYTYPRSVISAFNGVFYSTLGVNVQRFLFERAEQKKIIRTPLTTKGERGKIRASDLMKQILARKEDWFTT